jgi:hypothetical protein
MLELSSGTVTDVIAAHLPRWSPNGNRLLVSVVEGGFGIVDLDVSNRLELLRSTGWAAAWSPDGRQVLFNDAGLTDDSRAADASEPVLQAPPPGEAIAGFTEGGVPFLVVRHEGGSLTAVEAISPYLADGSVRQLLGWCAARRTFDDPSGGAKFDEYGRYVSGPSPSGLARLDVEIVTEDPLTFRLGDLQPPLPRDEVGDRPTGPSCLEAGSTLRPGIAAGGLSPAELAAAEPPIEGTRWSVDGTLVLSPTGEARLCDGYADGVCSDGAPVEGPSTEGPDEIVVEGTWYVVARDGVLTDPIWAPA